MEIIAVLTGIVYIILATQNNAWCWLFGIMSSIAWAYTVFTVQLYIDTCLQLYYVLIALHGWWKWTEKNRLEPSKNVLKIHELSLKIHVYILLMGVSCSILLSYLFKTYTAAVSTHLDALATVFSIIATTMTTRRIIDNWIYWIFINALYIYLYFIRETYLLASASVLYAVLAIFGYIAWKSIRLKEENTPV